MTGLRIANMNSRSALYKALKTQEIIQQLLIIKQDDDSYQFMLKGFTYSANGDVLSFKKTYETDSLPANQSNENEKTVTSEIVNESITPDVEAFINQSFNYLPKGNLPGIVNYADSSFDFFWIMSIIDMMKTKSHPKIISFDELGLMMIANAWEILNEYPIFADKIDGLNKCIDYIKKKYPNIVETCSKGRRILYQELHILLQDNIIKHAIEIMTNKSSYNVLRTWFKTDNDSQIYIKSLSFGNACLYAIYPREEDPYIYFNSSWQWLFLTDNAKLYKYFKIKLLKYLVEKNKD